LNLGVRKPHGSFAEVSLHCFAEKQIDVRILLEDSSKRLAASAEKLFESEDGFAKIEGLVDNAAEQHYQHSSEKITENRAKIWNQVILWRQYDYARVL